MSDKVVGQIGQRTPVDNGGEPPDDGRMEHRITALETRLDTILPTLATKADIGEIRADLHKVSSEIKGWTLATMITIIGTMLAAIFGISQIFKNAIPGAPAAAPAPIVIYAQPGPAAAAPVAPPSPTTKH
jgi:hypothetical protein